jgi:hypothetical protein
MIKRYTVEICAFILVPIVMIIVLALWDWRMGITEPLLFTVCLSVIIVCLGIWDIIFHRKIFKGKKVKR